MNIEVLVSTMNQKITDLSLAKKMNIQTKATIINQTDEFGYSNEQRVEMYSYPERGVGKSRNSALLRATGDICLMADDDMVYVDNYEEIVEKAYEKYKDADFIVFNVRVHYPDRTVERVSKPGRVRFFNSLKYGTVTFSFYRNAIIRENVFFSLLFGGGAKFSSGEDTLFLWTCLKKGLKVYAEETVIADVYNYESSWFKGYNEKFYKDKGALFKALEPKWHLLLNLQLAIRKRKEYGSEKTIFEILKIMNTGAKEFKNL
ncbi:glycosyltransferase family A protein [Carnobacterium sp. ISL-102]|uniref:glycosyltransferase family A protein n=1 Tax=Carnobacterium sp. ISL-102 TaxID=2819142 RepID=UPI001BEB2905|nr:glycosyltransferase family A protein [Carnobacterium sp. ISL-102]MBT2731100.1 glycosyltransferase family 2 protein [Carnobacterium sp. ISL-102]